ncbi:MAG TPA: GNAT family N-acetyltransferase [bacterium]|nr:GNAT family N-acetyltransferase [bacterium]
MNPPDGTRLQFCPLTEDDLPLLVAWLNTPEVAEWYYEPGQPPTPEFVAGHYGPLVRGEEPTYAFIIRIDGDDAGYIQWYRIGDWPEYANQIGVGEGMAGVDLFLIGAYQNRGLGPQAIESFLEQVVFRQPGIRGCAIGPDERNARAIRCYEKAGFVYSHTAAVAGEEAPEYIMVRMR